MPQGQETSSAFAPRFLEVEANGVAATLSLRRQAREVFEAAGLPTPRHEEWKYTDVRSLRDWIPKYADPEQSNSPSASQSAAQSLESALAGVPESDQSEAIRLVFLDGVFSAQHSRNTESANSADRAPDGTDAGSGDTSDSGSGTGTEESAIIVQPLSQACAEKGDTIAARLGTAGPCAEFVFAALNTALHQDGGFIHIPAGQTLDRPVHIIHISTARGDINTSHPRNLVVLGENAQVRILEDYVSLEEGAFFTNPMTELILENNAQLDHYRFVRENNRVIHLATTWAKLGQDAQLTTHTMSQGGKLVRNDLRVYLGGPGAGCILNGLNVANGTQLMDDHTTIIHAVPRCCSREFYRAVLDDESRGVFNGKVFVCPDAQKTDGVQENKGLILSSQAQMNTKPQLEIFADDVRCTHGATVGQLDHDALFYLQSRGLEKTEARRILVHAFAHNIIERMKYGPAKALATDLLNRSVVLS